MTPNWSDLARDLMLGRPTEADFNGDTSDEALAAWDVYKTIPTNYDASPEQSEQDAFTAGFDLGKKTHA